MKQVTDATFDKDVLEAAKPVLVDFYASWCGPCKKLSPVLEQLSGELQGEVEIVKIDSDDNIDTIRHYEIRSLPTLVLFKDGEEVTRVSGFMTKDKLVEFLNAHK